MRPFFFGTSAQPLFGIYHAALDRPPRRTAVLLCNPFGQEAIFAHRMFRVMANRLTQLGFQVLRFDYHGTGDSSGECTEATLERWAHDVATASEELMETGGAKGVAWVGLRLGAAAAAAAARRDSPDLSALVLWEPIVNGPRHLEELRRAHFSLLEADLVFPMSRRIRSRSGEAHEPDQAMGFAIPETLRADVRGLDPLRLQGIRARRVLVVGNIRDDDVASLRAQLAEIQDRCSWFMLDEAGAWNSERALNSSVIPMAAVTAIVDWLEQLP